MTLQLDWPPDVIARVTEEARHRGMSLDAYLLETVIQKTSNGSPLPSETDTRQAREEAGRNIRELREGNILGGDVSIRELIEEGRRL